MAIPGDINNRVKDSIIESTTVANQPAQAIVNPDGSNVGGSFGASAAGADAVANPTMSKIFSYIQGFNGTTWDRLRAGITTATATLTGFLNTLPWAVYNTTPATRTNGQGGPLEADTAGSLLNRETYSPGYEDNTNGVAKVEQRFSYSAVAVADVQVKASAGFLHTVTISCNDAAPTAGSIIIYDNTAESGTVVFNHTFTTTPFVPFSVTLDYTMATGIYIGFTTTGDVNVSCSYR